MFLAVYGWLDVVPRGRNETKHGNLGDGVRRNRSRRPPMTEAS